MFSFLDGLGLPLKFAVIGFVAGVLWLGIAAMIGYESDSSPLAMLGAFTGGGLVGGYLRQRSGRSD
jgi:hypothetical protein